MQTVLTKQIIPISDFRIRQGQTLKKMENGPVYLAQRSKPVAVLVAAEQWDATIERLMQMEKILAEQEFARQFSEIDKGNFVELTLEDIERIDRESTHHS